jgi:hypothetical protein
MITETIVAIVFILGFILLHTWLKGSKVYNYITLLLLPFVIFFLFTGLSEKNSSGYLLILMLTSGFIYQAVKFYNKFLKQA